jgi:CPA2 family monovalent cation:H+ antiporter-2
LHLPPFIQDLGIILLAAGFFGLLFKKLKQPIVLGYLLAGFFVSPEVTFLPTVREKLAIQIWAEIGVIVLLFCLGLDFSFKKLLKVGRGATITAVIEVPLMLGLGYLTGQFFGWSFIDSIFLGGIIAISSTTIIIRAVEELGLGQRGFVGLVFGILVVEDLVAVLLLVLLSTISVTNSFQGSDLLISTAKLGFFLSIWFLGGIFLVPWLMRKTRSLMNDETSLIVALGLCLLMVILANQAGFSSALGAFIMGSILAETSDGEKIEQNLRSVKNLFAAIFFVSVGMLIEIEPIIKYWDAILIISLILILGKTFSVSLGALIAGQSIKTSMQSGMSLAQIGEFSFIIATLGLNLGVTSKFLYPVAVAVSALTTLTTPYLIRASDPLYQWIQNKLPQKLKNRSVDDVKMESISYPNTSLHRDVFRLFFNSVVIVASGFAVKKWIFPFADQYFGNQETANFICAIVAIVLSAPSLWAIVNSSSFLQAEGYRIEDVKNLATQSFLALVARILFSLFMLAMLISQFISAFWSFSLVAVCTLICGFLGARNFSKIYQWLEFQFLSHLNEKQNTKKENLISQLAPWDAHLSRLKVGPNSIVVGKKLSEIGVREKYGVTIAMMERGQKQLAAPGRDDIIMAYDTLLIIGTDEQLEKFAQLIHTENLEQDLSSHHPYELQDILLHSEHAWVGKSIRDSEIRELTDGLVVGIERKGRRILNPDSSMVLLDNDQLWIVGNPIKIQKFH